MIDPKDLNQKCEALNDLLRRKHGLRGKTFEARLNRAGRLLPKFIHREGQIIVEAQRLTPHPKLAATVDSTRVNKAVETITNHLSGINPNDRRIGKLLGWLGGQVFNFLLIAGVLIALLMWRGFIG